LNFVRLRVAGADAPAGRATAIERMDQSRLAYSHHADRQGRKRQRSAAVQWQVFDVLRCNGLARRRVLRHQQRCIATHLNGLAGVADFEPHVDQRMVARPNMDPLRTVSLNPGDCTAIS